MSFPDAIFAALRSDPDGIVAEQVTSAELLGMTSRIAAGMRAHKVKQGTGVAMITGETPAVLAAHLAAFALGATVVHGKTDNIDLDVTEAKITELLESEDEPLLVTSKPADVALVANTGSKTYEEMVTHWTWDGSGPFPGFVL